MADRRNRRAFGYFASRSIVDAKEIPVERFSTYVLDHDYDLFGTLTTVPATERGGCAFKRRRNEASLWPIVWAHRLAHVSRCHGKTIGLCCGIQQRAGADQRRGVAAGGRRNGGSDPGLRRLVPPQTFPCSFRRSGGRYRQSMSLRDKSRGADADLSDASDFCKPACRRAGSLWRPRRWSNVTDHEETCHRARNSEL